MRSKKAATRTDQDRFWDSLLGLMECETAAPYPDPALQVPINASHVCYLATANRIDTLPPPLLDRMRMLRFPTARAEDLDSLLPVVVDELARERGLDSRWIAALTVAEREALAAHWRGGSVRRLARRQRRAHAALPSCGEGSEEYAVAARAAASASRPMKPSARSSCAAGTHPGNGVPTRDPLFG